MNNILVVILLCIIHYFLINGLEKIIFDVYNLKKDNILRPINNCKTSRNYNTYCLGMPSGHTETTTILCFILYKLNHISLSNMILIICFMCYQRIITNKHTLLQTIIGVTFGLLYSNIYLKIGLSYKSLIFALFIAFIYINIIILNIDNKVNKKIPEWVDKKMLKYIEKKRNVIYSVKVASIISASLLQNTFLFMSWKDLEYYLDMIIENIRKTNIKYDAIVGLKTGGAIISDYISRKLNIKNYKIKFSKKKYECKKTSKDFFNNYYNEYIKKENSEFMICEGINDDLKNKNIILIDELVSSGNTMNFAIDYLLSKNVTTIYPTTILSNLKNKNLTHNYNLDYILYCDYVVFVYPWGYDN